MHVTKVQWARQSFSTSKKKAQKNKGIYSELDVVTTGCRMPAADCNGTKLGLSRFILTNDFVYLRTFPSWLFHESFCPYKDRSQKVS
ncbi:hypothetical protein KKG55_05355 [Candidatus Micrarchaeota archaeon]|nr:hypothetical protein [Candidatus Micrarchaeota archaeon]MBU1887141.1 hypothetical protein [Candidatus Micrarchaeota archaeon]